MTVTIRSYREKDHWRADKGFRTRPDLFLLKRRWNSQKMEPSDLGTETFPMLAERTRIFQTHLGISFGLAAAVGVVVVVRAFVSVFVNSVQKPEQELEGIVLRVPSKLRGVPCHRALRRGETSTFILGCFQKSLNTNVLPDKTRPQLSH